MGVYYDNVIIIQEISDIANKSSFGDSLTIYKDEITVVAPPLPKSLTSCRANSFAQRSINIKQTTSTTYGPPRGVELTYCLKHTTPRPQNARSPPQFTWRKSLSGWRRASKKKEVLFGDILLNSHELRIVERASYIRVL